MYAGALVLTTWLPSGLAGCGRSPESTPAHLLARVGEVEITVDDLRAFQSGLAEGVEERMGLRVQLQTLVDRELLLLEAGALGLERDEAVLRELADSETRKLAETMLHRQLAQVSVTEAEIDKAYAREGWDEQVKALEIFVSTAEQADRVVDLLRRGMDFVEVGRRHSLDPYFGVPSGGPKTTVYWAFSHPRVLVEALYSLSPGGVTPPVPVRGGFVIATVVERRKAERAEVAEEIRQVLAEEQGTQLRHSYLRHLKWDFGTRFHDAGMDRVVAALRGAVSADSLTEEERHRPVYSFEGFQMDVAEVLKAVQPGRARWAAVSADAVNQELAKSHFPNTLMAHDARRKGVDRTGAFRRWRQARREDLMLLRLRQRVLAGGVAVSESDLERFYQDHKQRFRSAPWARVQEVLVSDPVLARELAAQIRTGTPMGPLARAHSQRRNGADGVLEVSTSHAPVYGETWMQAVMNAPLNEVRGPIKATGGYSVFKVLERHPEQYYTLASARVRRAVTRDVRLQKERELFNRHLEGLRRKYADRIEVHEENLEAVARRDTAPARG